jgi:glycerophosphoryl diester phosphodiesterase
LLLSVTSVPVGIDDLLFFSATGNRSPAFTGNAWSARRIGGVAVEYLDHPRPLAFAHRGGAGHRPENSWRAFEYAVQLGYAYLETDTRSTSDGKLIAFHDAELDRVTDRTGQVSNLTWNEVCPARSRRGGSSGGPMRCAWTCTCGR